MGVWRLFPLIFAVAGLVFWGLVSIHHWLAFAFAGCLLGFTLALMWAGGKKYQYVEYWNRTFPRWMLIIYGSPPLDDSRDVLIPRIAKWHYYVSFATSLLLVIGIGITISLTLLAIFSNNIFIGFAVMFTITWIGGIALFKRYFTIHKFTKIKDWSKYPPE